jgi:hypothetical protein
MGEDGFAGQARDARKGRHAGVCRLPIRPRRLLLGWTSSSNGTIAQREPRACGGDVNPPFVSAVVGRIETVPSPVSVWKPPRFRDKSWEASPITVSSETAVLQYFLGTLGISRSACHAEGRGFESLQPLRRIRLYRASNDVSTVLLAAVLRNDFPAGCPLGAQTFAPGVGHDGLLNRAAQHPSSGSTAAPPMSSTCW